MSTKMHVKSGDEVIVISGKDKGKKGKVLSVNAEKRTVIVEGVSIATKHKKPRKMGETGGICDKCGAPTRVGRRVLEDGEHVRYCKKCGETF